MTGQNSGEQFGEYRLERRIAVGGMAEIFLGVLQKERGFAKKVVLKRILPQFGADPIFVRMFVDEALIAARLTHPNIVQVYDFGEQAGVYYIAMEWVDGVDLSALLEETARIGRPLSPVEVAAIGEGVCRGLAHAHECTDDEGRPLQIVHRDVSPHNVMLARSGEPKVMDFGIAKAEERATRTATGTIKGKVAYMAPEHARGESIDRRSDQFAVGLVLWECLTGERLFTGDTDREIMDKVSACETVPPSALRAGVPPSLERIIMRALASEPDDRYPDLGAMERDLSAYRFSLGAEGVVSLATLVEQVAPRRPTGEVLARPRGTMPLVAEPRTPELGATLHERPGRTATATATMNEPGIESRFYEAAGAPSREGARPGRADLSPLANLDREDAPSWDGTRQTQTGVALEDPTLTGTGGFAEAPRAAALPPPQSATRTRSQVGRDGGGRKSAGDESSGERSHGRSGKPSGEGPDDRSGESFDEPDEAGELGDLDVPGAGARGSLLAPAAIIGVAAVIAVIAVFVWRSRREGPPQIVELIPAPVEPAAAPATVMVRVESEPSGARVAVDGADTGLTTPAVLPRREVGTPITVTLSLAGFRTHETRLVPSGHPGTDPYTHAVHLEPAPEPAPATAPVVRGRVPGKNERAAASPTDDPVGSGELSLRVRGGWADVYLGARKLGTTPLRAVTLRAGTHRLRLVNRDVDLDRTMDVEISAGEHVERTIDLP